MTKKYLRKSLSNSEAPIPGTWEEFDPTTVDYLKFNETPSVQVPTAVGVLSWNNTEKTLDLQMPDGVTLQIGQETQAIATNNTGSPLLNGQVVRVSGATGNRVTIALADADGVGTNEMIGMLTQDIANNQSGKVTLLGLVRQINTSAFTEGASVYLSTTPGGITTTPPALPTPTVLVGYVARSHAVNGSILVHVRKNPTLLEIGAADNEVVEDGRMWSGFADPDNITQTYDSTARTVTTSHSSGTIEMYWRGRKITKASPWVTAAHTNTLNTSWYYYSNDGVNFSWSNTVWDFDDIQVAFVRYGTNVKFGIREAHGLMDPYAHEIGHRKIWTILRSGGALTAGTYAIGGTASDANNSPGIDAAVLLDEDIATTVPSAAEGSYVCCYPSSGEFVVTAQSLPFLNSAASYIRYYPNDTGTFVLGQTGKFYNVYLVIIPAMSDTGSQSRRHLWIAPQAEYDSLTAAQAESFDGLRLGDLATGTSEYLPRCRLTFGSSAAYSTTGKVRLEGVDYLERSPLRSSGSSVPALSGSGTPGLPAVFSSANSLVSQSVATFLETIGVDANATKESVNILSFGAIGDGITDDRAAIQSAIDYAASIGGADVIFPVRRGQTSTTYLVKGGRLYVCASGIRLIGSGNVTIKKGFVSAVASPNLSPTDSDKRALLWVQPSSTGLSTGSLLEDGTRISDVQISGLKFDGSRSFWPTQTVTSNMDTSVGGIRIKWGQRIKLSDCVLREQYRCAVTVSDSLDMRINDNWIIRWGEQGVFFSGAQIAHIHDNEFTGGGGASGTADCSIVAIDFECETQNTYKNITSVKVSDNIIRNCKQAVSALVNDYTSGLIDGLNISDNLCEAMVGNDIAHINVGRSTQTGTNANVTIKGNTVKSTGDICSIFVFRTDKVVISANSVYSEMSGTAGVRYGAVALQSCSNWTVAGNSIETTLRPGVAVWMGPEVSASRNAVISGNTVNTGANADGIKLVASTGSSTVKLVAISGNTCDGGAITIGGDQAAFAVEAISVTGNTVYRANATDAAINILYGIASASLESNACFGKLFVDKYGSYSPKKVHIGAGNQFSGGVDFGTAVTQNWRDLNPDEVAYTAGDTTPSIEFRKNAVLVITNASPTTITSFDDWTEGAEVTCVFKDANTTIQNFVSGATGIKTGTGANVTPSADTAMRFRRVAGLWFRT